jgi:hypothetical protein
MTKYRKYKIGVPHVMKYKEGGNVRMYNVTVRRDRATSFAVGKQHLLRISSVYL